LRNASSARNSTKKKTAEYWYAKSEKGANLAPQRKLAKEKPQGDYDELIKSWKKV
jgi:glycerol transport system substrate-binding protein